MVQPGVVGGGMVGMQHTPQQAGMPQQQQPMAGMVGGQQWRPGMQQQPQQPGGMQQRPMYLQNQGQRQTMQSLQQLIQVNRTYLFCLLFLP
jgi:hypothetical protein